MKIINKIKKLFRKSMRIVRVQIPYDMLCHSFSKIEAEEMREKVEAIALSQKGTEIKPSKDNGVVLLKVENDLYLWVFETEHYFDGEGEENIFAEQILIEQINRSHRSTEKGFLVAIK